MRSPNITLHIKITTNIYNTHYLPILSYNSFAFCVNISLSLQTLSLVLYLHSWGVIPLLSVGAYTMVLQLILYYSCKLRPSPSEMNQALCNATQRPWFLQPPLRTASARHNIAGQLIMPTQFAHAFLSDTHTHGLPWQPWEKRFP
jgi:hypothetical protein